MSAKLRYSPDERSECHVCRRSIAASSRGGPGLRGQFESFRTPGSESRLSGTGPADGSDGPSPATRDRRARRDRRHRRRTVVPNHAPGLGPLSDRAHWDAAAGYRGRRRAGVRRYTAGPSTKKESQASLSRKTARRVPSPVLRP
eukprot:746672-Hanusia_phi.AAC.1